MVKLLDQPYKNPRKLGQLPRQTLPCKKVPIVGQASSYKEKRSQSGHVSEIRGKSLVFRHSRRVYPLKLKLTPGSPKDQTLLICVVGNPLYESS